MSDNKPSKPWSQQTIEERVHTHLRHQEDFVKRIDPDEQMLTHDNFLNRPVDYHIVDINRSFLTRLQSIVDNPAKRKPLTDEEIEKILIESAGMTVQFSAVDLRFARAIEHAHGIGGDE